MCIRDRASLFSSAHWDMSDLSITLSGILQRGSGTHLLSHAVSSIVPVSYTHLENQSSCVSSGRSSFVLANAEHYAVPSSVDRVYFFNPFSLELLQKVMARILDSYYEHPRSILLFFYYPSDSYLSYLTSVPEMA